MGSVVKKVKVARVMKVTLAMHVICANNTITSIRNAYTVWTALHAMGTVYVMPLRAYATVMQPTKETPHAVNVLQVITVSQLALVVIRP